MAKGMSKGFKITAGILAVIVVFVLLVMVIGSIADRTAGGSVEEIRNNALTFLESYAREGDGNAEQYFTEAAEGIRDETVNIHTYLMGGREISAQVTKAILDNLEVIGKIRQGAQMEFYCYPYEYEKGAAAELPDFRNLNEAIRLTCAKALFDMEQGRSDQSMDALLDVTRAGKLIASDTPVLFDMVMGNSFAEQSLNVLKLGLESGAFDAEQLERIDGFLQDLEREWPRVALPLEGEVHGMAITFCDALKQPGSVMQMGELLSDSMGDIFRFFLLRILCWRTWFSLKRTFIAGHETMKGLVTEFKQLEEIPLSAESREERIEKFEAFNEHLKQAMEGNFLLNLTYPSVFGMHNQRLELLTLIRAERLACALFAFQRGNMRFPVNLEEMGGELIYDFNTGKLWEYENDGDAVVIASNGPDLKSGNDNVIIRLTNLGAKEYFKQKRASKGKQ